MECPRIMDTETPEQRRERVRANMLLHRKGEYALSEKERERERLKKRRQRARRREAAREAAEALLRAGSNDVRLVRLLDKNQQEAALERIAAQREDEERAEMEAAFVRLRAAMARTEVGEAPESC